MAHVEAVLSSELADTSLLLQLGAAGSQTKTVELARSNAKEVEPASSPSAPASKPPPGAVAVASPPPTAPSKKEKEAENEDEDAQLVMADEEDDNESNENSPPAVEGSAVAGDKRKSSGTSVAGTDNNGPSLNTRESKRKRTLPDKTPLITWLGEHENTPYPTDQEKAAFVISTGMPMAKITAWFCNARQRILKQRAATARLNKKKA